MDYWVLLRFYTQCLAMRNAARVTLAMHAFRNEHNRWPETLAEATADEAMDIRQDPFSGGEFVYKVRNGQPIVYSVGLNGRDDGGRVGSRRGWGQDSDFVFWPALR